MSGHSKFANIKHKKEKNDAAKGKIFTIIGREIAVAVKEGGPDPSNNFKLAQVIAKAKSNNMPNDTIERGIKKAAGDLGDVTYQYNTYEGYGPAGVAIIVDTLTDNPNRTGSDVRAAFSKGGGDLGTPGCVSFMFDEKGQILIDKEDCDLTADDLMMIVLDAGAEDLKEEDDSFEILTSPDDFEAVTKALDEAAIIDGCTYYGVFFKILLPLLKPAIVTSCLLKGVGVYNEYYMSSLYLQASQLKTISTALYTFTGPYGNQYNYICAGVLITIAPILILFLFFQRQVYGGMAAGAVKE